MVSARIFSAYRGSSFTWQRSSRDNSPHAKSISIPGADITPAHRRRRQALLAGARGIIPFNCCTSFTIRQLGRTTYDCPQYELAVRTMSTSTCVFEFTACL